MRIRSYPFFQMHLSKSMIQLKPYILAYSVTFLYSASLHPCDFSQFASWLHYHPRMILIFIMETGELANVIVIPLQSHC